MSKTNRKFNGKMCNATKDCKNSMIWTTTTTFGDTTFEYVIKKNK